MNRHYADKSRVVFLQRVVFRGILAPLWLALLGTPTSLFAQPALDVLIVLDQSRSMKQSDPKRIVPQAVSELIQHLQEENAVGLVLFGSQAWPVQNLQSLAEEHRRQLLTSVADIRYSDAQSNPVAAIEAALDEFRSRSRREATPLIILLTDGGIDTGSKTRDSEIQHVLETQIMTEVRRRKIRIYPIAFTTGADLSLLEKIARESGGESYLALTPDALESSFGRLRDAIDRLMKPVSGNSQAAEGRESAPITAPVGNKIPSSSNVATNWVLVGLAWLAGLVAAACFVAYFVTTKQSSKPGQPFQEATLVDLRTGKAFRIQKKTISVGRKPDNDLVIAEQTVSAQHARIRFEKGKFYLQDLQSANETKINGQKVVGEVELRNGDVVRFDQFGYTFKGPDVDAERTLLRS